MIAQRTWTTPRGLGATLAAVALLAAGCGAATEEAGSVATNPPKTSAPVKSAPTAATGEPSSPSQATGSATAARPAESEPPLCQSGDLELSLGRGDGAAGTVWRPLRFTNVSDSSCEIQGFPGVSYVAGEDGHQVGAAANRDGAKGAAVTVAQGATAYAAVGFAQVGNYDPDECKPTEVRGLRVYPPQETRSLFVEYSTTGCANEDIPGNQLTVQTI
ncbi:MAG: DUF4232 domain-containing protein, partial [Pseudonocardiaceae bacterium]